VNALVSSEVHQVARHGDHLTSFNRAGDGDASSWASELALWTSGNAHVVKYVRLAQAGSPLKVCTTRSYLTLYWPVLRHANS
jgi:hypothetical protein